MIAVAWVAVLCVLFGGGVVVARTLQYFSQLPGVIRFVYFGGPRPKFFSTVMPAIYIRDYLWWTPVTILMETLPALLVATTPAALAFRLRKPRPAWRDLIRQPGAVACLVVIGMCLLEVDLRWIGVPIPTEPIFDIAAAVLLTWTVMWVSGVGSPEAGWIDRFGRLVGLGWIVLAIIWVIVEFRGN